MESGIVAAIALIILIGGGAVLLARQHMLPWSMPAFRRVDHGGAEAAAVTESAITPANEPRRAMETSVAVLTGLQESRRDSVPAIRVSTVAIETRLDQMEARLDALAAAFERHRAELSDEVRRAGSELAARAESDEARRAAALERLRADILAAIAVSPGGDRLQTSTARRADVCAELYAALARLEAALAAVTNPILLPGEPYTPTAELAPEALIWENWNEIGERAFALADTYSAQRLYLSEQTRAEIGSFITVMRTLLTRSVYPNLQREPNPAQRKALREALEEIAAEFPRVRETLEREYREVRAP